MGKEIGCSFKYKQSKIFTPTFKKHLSSSSSSHTSYARYLTTTFISSQLENEDSTEIQNKNNTSNTNDIHSCVTHQKQNYSVQATSTTTCLTRLNTTLHIAPVELQKKTKLPPVGKEYLCFHINNKSPHASQCVKSMILNKAIG